MPYLWGEGVTAVSHLTATAGQPWDTSEASRVSWLQGDVSALAAHSRQAVLAVLQHHRCSAQGNPASTPGRGSMDRGPQSELLGSKEKWEEQPRIRVAQYRTSNCACSLHCHTSVTATGQRDSSRARALLLPPSPEPLSAEQHCPCPGGHTAPSPLWGAAQL